MRIVIIDDERPARSELVHQIRELLPEAVITEGDSGAAALEIAGEGRYDLFFLDINLGDIAGTALVKAIRKMQPGAKIVFVTAYSEYAVDAFDLGVSDYVLKPYDKSRIRKVLERCDVPSEQERILSRRIAISSEGKTVFEDIDNLVYIETYKRGCLIHAVDHEYYEGKGLLEYEKRLEGRMFFRCHKSYLINLEKVKELFPWGNNSLGIKMEGYEHTVLPVGREKTKILRQLLGW